MPIDGQDDFNSILNQLATQRAQQATQSPAGTRNTTPTPSSPPVPSAPALPQQQPQAAPQQAEQPAPQAQAQADQSQPQDQGQPQAAAPQDPFEAILAQQAQKSQQADLGTQQGSFKNPIPLNPLSAQESFKVGVGNTKGNLAYLKGKFDDVGLSEQNGLVVKKDNQWYKIDPSDHGWKLQDPWSLSKDISDVMDLAESVPGRVADRAKRYLTDPSEVQKDIYGSMGNIGLNVAGASTGAAEGASAGAALGSVVPGAGTAAGAVVGGIIGAGLGGVSSGAVRTSLGRLVGTYDATPQEQIKDIALEGLLTAGGQAVAVGTKPTLEMLAKAGKTIGNLASEPAKDVLSSGLGASTGAGKAAIQTIIDNPADYAQAFKNIASGAPGTDGIVHEAVGQQIAHTTDLLETASKALPNKYGELLDNLIEKANKKNISVNLTDILSKGANVIEDNGYGKVVSMKSGHDFIPFTSEEIAQRVTSGLPAESLGPKEIADIKEMVNKLSPYSKIGEVKNGAAASALQHVNKAINQISDDAFKGEISPAAARAIGSISQSFREGVSEAFEKSGLEVEYGALQDTYKTYADAVSNARTVLRNDGQEALVKKLVSGAGKNYTAKGEASLLVKLGGQAADKAYKGIVLADAVKNTASWAPKMSLPLKVGAAASVGSGVAAGHAAALLNPFTLGVAGPIATQFSPRLVGKQIVAASQLGGALGAGTKAVLDPTVNYAFQSLDFLRTLSIPALKQFLNNPQAVQHVLQTPGDATQGEQQDTINLLQKSGVIRGQQQQ